MFTQKKVIFLICSILSIVYYLFLYSPTNTPILSEEEEEQDKMEANIARMQQEVDKIKDPVSNEIPANALSAARASVQSILEETPVIEGVNWIERGPNNIGGRTRAILFDIADNTNNTVYAGSVGGGLWKTTNFQNASPTWTEVDPFFGNLAVTCIAQDPVKPNIIYFGTGEGWFNSDAIQGLGIWKTINGGSTWTQIASTNNNSNFYYVTDLLVDGNENVYAATRNRGVQRSTDGGTNWAQVLGSSVGFGSTNRAADLEVGADGTLYASLGIFSTGGVYKSNTGAAGAWTNITPSGSWRRIEIATAPSDANRVYLLCQGSGSSNVTGMYRSTNKGDAWTSINIPTICDQGQNNIFTRNQAWYDLIAAVDPNNADRLYVGGVDALRSNDGGSTWVQISDWANNARFFCSSAGIDPDYVHADHHAIVFQPGSSTSMVIGSDGGIAHTTNATTNEPSFTIKNTGYNVTQFYACAVHPTSGSNYFLAGAQDNGTQRFTSAGLNNTSSASGGDGSFCHIDQDDPNIQITSYVYNRYYISTNGGSNFISRTFNNNGSFINPTDYDNTGNKLYAGYATGSYFRWNDPATAGTSVDIVSTTNLSSITHVAVSPNFANRVYFGDNAGKVVLVENAHTGTAKTGVTLLDEVGSVSSIAIEDGNENHILVTYSNYNVTSIFETVNGGTSWTSIEGNMPNMPVRWIIFNPKNTDQAFVATELGVWSTSDLNGSSTVWEVTNTGLANVRVDMLQYRASDDLIAAATHGRGLFTAIDYGTPTCLATLTVNDAAIASATYQSSNTIISTGGVPDGNNVTFDAKTSIELQENFHADSGSVFVATVGVGCSAALLPDNTALEETRQVIDLPRTLEKEQDVEFSIYPSPASGTVTVDFTLAQTSETIITVHNSMGKLVKTIQATSTLAKGQQQLSFNATDLQDGLYYVVISTPQVRRSQKLMIVRR